MFKTVTKSDLEEMAEKMGARIASELAGPLGLRYYGESSVNKQEEVSFMPVVDRNGHDYITSDILDETETAYSVRLQRGPEESIGLEIDADAAMLLCLGKRLHRLVLRLELQKKIDTWRGNRWLRKRVPGLREGQPTNTAEDNESKLKAASSRRFVTPEHSPPQEAPIAAMDEDRYIVSTLDSASVTSAPLFHASPSSPTSPTTP